MKHSYGFTISIYFFKTDTHIHITSQSKKTAQFLNILIKLKK